MLGIRRRDFFTLIGGSAVTWPLAARGQQMRRVGVLLSTVEGDSEGQARLDAFREGLRALGWAEDRNIRIESRWGSNDPARLKVYAAELAALKPDVILAAPSSAVAAMYQETQSIPIVFAQVGDPVDLGLVTSLARPGGNTTGFAMYEAAIAVKWLELLKQLAPHVVRVAVIRDPAQAGSAAYLAKIEAGAPSFGVKVSAYAARDAGEIERAFDAVAGEPNSGLIVLPGVLAVTHRGLIVALAIRHRLPNVAAFRYYVTNGGLASYGVDDIDQYRRAASYVDRILRGEKPSDLPIQFPTKYELVINLKTAKAFGLDPPISLLARTDEVIE
jgi:putative ABC transport system substrate-binding protein